MRLSTMLLNTVFFFVSFLLTNCAFSHAILCATVYSADKAFKNSVFTLRDGSMLENLADPELNQEIGAIATATWIVHPSCKLNACTGIYMTEQCSSYKTGNFSTNSSWASVLCVCKKKCDCSTSFISHAACAKVYLEPRHCSSCNVGYTEIGVGDYEQFSASWRGKVSAITVRSDCNLTVFNGINFEGNSLFIKGPALQNRIENLSSMQCECSSLRNISTLTREPVAATNTTFPLLVDVPRTIDDVIKQLAVNNWTHPGLLAALSAISEKRSAQNVYMLVLGSSGAGKSSMINSILGTNLTTIGDYKSVTSEIIEHRIPLPLPELGIKNSELRIIDTPGLGDTGGLHNDTCFLATLENFLKTHAELKSKRPNFVLILHPFKDNRFFGDSSKLIKVVRVLDNIRDLFTDDSGSNILFVFSHLSSVSKELKRNPFPRIQEFKQAILNFTMFQEPLWITVAENLGSRQGLFMRSGNVQLPNFELYPQNVLDKLALISKRNKDLLGNAMTNSAPIRQKLIDPNSVKSSVYPLVGSTHESVAKFLKLLQSLLISADKSEIALSLTEGFTTMSADLKRRFPEDLQALVRLFYQQGIFYKSDLPKTLNSKLNLLLKVPKNDAAQYLLAAGLQFTPPEFPGSILVGNGFHILKNFISLPVSIFEISTKSSSCGIGFGIPKALTCVPNSVEGSKMKFDIFETEQDYFQHQLENFLRGDILPGMNTSIVYSNVVKNVKPGNLVKNECCSHNQTMVCFTITRAYKTFELNIAPPDTVNLHSDFLKLIKTLPNFNEHNYNNVQNWTIFFEKFGTHVVTSVDGGGRVDIQFELPKNLPDIKAEVEKVIKVLDFVDNPQNTALALKESYESVLQKSFGVQHMLTFRGGNSQFFIQKLSADTSLEKTANLFENWKKSIKYFPVIFPKTVEPISEIVLKYLSGSVQNETQEKIRVPLERLLNGSLRFTEDPKVVAARIRKEKEEEEARQRKIEEEKQEMVRQLEIQKKKQEEDLKRLEAEKKKKEKEAKALEAARIEQRRKLAEQERQRELQRQKEKEENCRSIWLQGHRQRVYGHRHQQHYPPNHDHGVNCRWRRYKECLNQ